MRSAGSGWPARLADVRKRLAARRETHRFAPVLEAGFTLIELMVVLLILAILMAVSIALFLGPRSTAEDRAAQSVLSSALIDANAQYTTNDGYQPTATQVTDLDSADPEYSFVSGATKPGPPSGAAGAKWTVQVATYDPGTNGLNDTVLLSTSAANGNCWAVLDVEQVSNGTTEATFGQGAGTWYAEIPKGSSSLSNGCVPSAFGAGSSWQSTWGGAQSNPS
jgi:prepilin-type N-terminal cleavage/methylation domain-containing protein